MNTLHPRTRGFVATVKSLRTTSHVKAIYDVTIAYSHGEHFNLPPSFLETLYLPNIGSAWTMYAHVQRFDISSLPEADEDIAKWLEERWLEKGDRLEQLKYDLLKGLPWNDNLTIIDKKSR